MYDQPFPPAGPVGPAAARLVALLAEPGWAPHHGGPGWAARRGGGHAVTVGVPRPGRVAVVVDGVGLAARLTPAEHAAVWAAARPVVAAADAARGDPAAAVLAALAARRI